jgi:hypothetical protein
LEGRQIRLDEDLDQDLGRTEEPLQKQTDAQTQPALENPRDFQVEPPKQLPGTQVGAEGSKGINGTTGNGQLALLTLGEISA